MKAVPGVHQTSYPSFFRIQYNFVFAITRISFFPGLTLLFFFGFAHKPVSLYWTTNIAPISPKHKRRLDECSAIKAARRSVIYFDSSCNNVALSEALIRGFDKELLRDPGGCEQQADKIKLQWILEGLL